MVWHEKDIPDADTSLVMLFSFELEMQFARVSRFCIFSWEKTMLGVSRCCSKTTVLCAVGSFWKFLLACGMVANLFPLGPFHPEGYPIILKHLSTRCPGYPQWEQVASGFPFFFSKTCSICWTWSGVWIMVLFSNHCLWVNENPYCICQGPLTLFLQK